MPWSVAGPKRTELRKIIADRFTREDIVIGMGDLQLSDPNFPAEMEDETWFFQVIEHLNRARQLPRLAEGLAQRLDENNPGDEDAIRLRKIAERDTPPKAPPVPPPNPRPEPAAAADDGGRNGSESSLTDAAGEPAGTLEGIVVLGEPTAISGPDIQAAHRKLLDALAATFGEKKIAVTDWGDRWDTRQGPAAEPGHANCLFVRVVNTDIVAGDIDALVALPKRLGRKLGMEFPLPLSQVMVWNCDPVAGAEIGQPVSTNIVLRAGQPDLFASVLKSKFGLEKSPPTISLENPGDNRAIEDRLISFVSARTATVCRPPDPQLVYMEAMSGGRTGETGAELRQLLDTDASRGGVIIAIHDLNVQMTDNPDTALWEFKDRLAEYDKLLAPIIKEKGFPDRKILKIAVIMTLGNALPLGQFPWRHKAKDWVVIGMKREKDEAVLIRNPDEGIISKHIDDLLRQT